MKNSNLLVGILAGFFSISLCIPVGAMAQETKKVMDFQEDKTQPKIQTLQSLPTTLPALDAPIDPAKYVVGPSDIFDVSIWTTNPISLALTVTPEGILIIPTVGEINVSGITLAEAKKRTLAEIRKKYLTGKPTVTLISPRPITIRVSGSVRTPGRYTLLASDRIEKAISEADKPVAIPLAVESESQRLIQIDLENRLKFASRRNIELRHRDGTARRIDLLKYYATRDDQWNPYLNEGDEVFVPQSDNPKRSIGIYGAVNQPGSYEYVDGDSFLDAIQLAYGFRRGAILDSVEFTTYKKDELNLATRLIDARMIIEHKAADFLLEPGDRVVVKDKPEFRNNYRVTVEGEVVYPATYPITRDHTRLSDIVARAGGVTEHAALGAATVIRRVFEREDYAHERILNMRGNVVRDDSTYVRLENELRIQGENVKVDFEKLLVQKDSTQDIILQSEDRIVVPSLQRTVYVYGQVVSPSQIPIVPGKGVEYYVKQAGGFTDFARSSDVVVIKRVSRQWVAPDEATVEDGDFVWVPKVRDRDINYYLTNAAQITTIITGALTVVLLYLQLKK